MALLIWLQVVDSWLVFEDLHYYSGLDLPQTFEDFLNFAGPKGGCASSRLDHVLKTHPGRLR